jgi:hypothetical protein
MSNQAGSRSAWRYIEQRRRFLINGVAWSSATLVCNLGRGEGQVRPGDGVEAWMTHEQNSHTCPLKREHASELAIAAIGAL